MDRWLSDGGSRGAGRLVAKIGQAGAIFYFVYFDAGDKRRFLPIGPFDVGGKRGVTLQRARDRAAELSAMYRNGFVGVTITALISARWSNRGRVSLSSVCGQRRLINGDCSNALRARAGSSAETNVFIASAFVGSHNDHERRLAALESSLNSFRSN